MYDETTNKFMQVEYNISAVSLGFHSQKAFEINSIVQQRFFNNSEH